MEKEEKAQVSEPTSHVIWFHWRNIRDLALVAAIVVFTWKILNADLKINIAEFSFTDLLALILALFAVWLSVMFYFKADEASSRFYDNSYRFTKEMGVVLGRMEAGFGERLKHLDEGYSGLRDALSKQLVSEAEVVEQKAAEVNKIVEDLVAPQEDGVPALDTSGLLSDLRKAQEELATAKNDLAQLEKLAHNERVSRLAHDAVSERLEEEKAGAEFFEFIAKRSVRRSLRLPLERRGDRDLQDLFDASHAVISPRALALLRSAGYLKGSQGAQLSTLGLARFRRALEESQP
jgi:hypothetical protein